MVDWKNFGGDFKIGVVMNQRQVMASRKCGDQQVGHADSAVAAVPGKLPLGA